jgi:hypothetical protein
MRAGKASIDTGKELDALLQKRIALIAQIAETGEARIPKRP